MDSLTKGDMKFIVKVAGSYNGCASYSGCISNHKGFALLKH